MHSSLSAIPPLSWMSFLYEHRSDPSSWQNDVAEIKVSELEAIETNKGKAYFLKRLKYITVHQ